MLYLKAELVDQLIACEKKDPTLKISRPEDAVPALLNKIGKKKTENFAVMTLDGANHIIGIRIITKGLINRTLVHPREVFRAAIRDNAAKVILSHNHPSGNLEFSRDDEDITKRLVNAGEIIGIEVLDHIVVNKDGFNSALGTGLI